MEAAAFNITDLSSGASLEASNLSEKLLSDSFLIRGAGLPGSAMFGVGGRISKELLPQTLGVGGSRSSSASARDARLGVGGRVTMGKVVSLEVLKNASDFLGGGVRSSTATSGSWITVASSSPASNSDLCSTLRGRHSVSSCIRKCE